MNKQVIKEIDNIRGKMFMHMDAIIKYLNENFPEWDKKGMDEWFKTDWAVATAAFPDLEEDFNRAFQMITFISQVHTTQMHLDRYVTTPKELSRIILPDMSIIEGGLQ